MKIIKLVQNETIKTFKKTSTKILVILSFLAIFGAVGFANLIMSLNNFTESYAQNEDWKNDIQEEIISRKRILESQDNHYDRESNALTRAEMETYEIALKYDINYLYYYNQYWKIQMLEEIQNAKVNLILNESINDEKVKEDNEKIINQRIELLKNNNYSGFIDLLKKDAKTRLDNKKIRQEEYDDEIYLLNIREKYEIYKDDSNGIFNWRESLYEDILAIKSNLRTGINQTTGKLLKTEEIDELKDKLKVAEYRLENNIPILSTGASARGLYDLFAPSFTMLMISLLMVIIAGSSISTEISKGTIKFLLFTPNKRWKVLVSKIISAILILVVLTLILSLLSTIIGNIFFKENGSAYVYSSHGEVKVLSNVTYNVLYFLAQDIDILVYMFFAFMLSVLTRNTALSVGVSIACYIGSGTIMQLINYYISADWVKFIPFNNLGLADKIFANNLSYTMQNMPGVSNGISIGFSCGVLVVCVILMIITMFDSFNKRDIV